MPEPLTTSARDPTGSEPQRAALEDHVTRRFALAFDYLCPFARNANEHVTASLRAGADWDVTFLPYSLAQGHVEEGDRDVWDRDRPRARAPRER